MCAASLETADAPTARVQAGSKQQNHSSGSHHREEVQPPVEQEGIVCAECGTMNEPGWSFCQQCGKRLAPAAAPPKMPPDLKTVPEQRAVDPIMQGLKTNPEPLPAEHSYKTVVAQPPIEPQEQPMPTPATVVAERFVPEPQPEPDESELRTVETPAVPKPTAPTPTVPVHEKPEVPPPPPSIPKPSIPPPPSIPAAAADESSSHGQPMSGALCNQCGQSNTVGSAFCASCGAPMTFGGKTMVISSQPAPTNVIGRLHLVMEGGQPGEVYELSGDTVIGRNNGEITFPHDGFMSGRHARIERRGSSFILSDAGSRNGTFIKTKGEVELQPGDMILVGKQLFRFEV